MNLFLFKYVYDYIIFRCKIIYYKVILKVVCEIYFDISNFIVLLYIKRDIIVILIFR